VKQIRKRKPEREPDEWQNFVITVVRADDGQKDGDHECDDGDGASWHVRSGLTQKFRDSGPCGRPPDWAISLCSKAMARRGGVWHR